MPIFPNAHGVIIHDSRFIENTMVCGPTGIDILLEASVPEAAVDSGAWEHPPCLPTALERYIDDVARWATVCIDDQSPPYVYWMKGPACVGKTVIARASAEKLKEQGHLGAAFFFSHDRRDDHTRFFTTLAYQLATVFPEYRDILDRRVRQDRTLVGKRISSQFDALIAEPLRELEERGKRLPGKAIFVDGLNECGNEGAQSEIIEIILSSVRDGSTPFCWAFFSRPEPHIEAAFFSDDITTLCKSVILPNSPQTDGYGQLLLEDEIKNILQRFNLMFFSPWGTVFEDDDMLEDEELPEEHLRRHSALKFLLAGGFAGAVSRTYTAPLDRLRVFLVTRPLSPGNLPSLGTKNGVLGIKNMANAAVRIYTEGGFSGFWTGNGLSVVKMFPESMIRFFVYESGKRAFAKHWDRVDDPREISGLSRFLSGGVAGVISQMGV